ncbi:phosphoenolpyruvate synthase regulatory protein [Acuticoccus sediminis]|uniref:Putative pyruvate, phosphate dikinase regulatory protein n=1 Tax=Acuticoccus sediminis TaxID=2184697 RepID=A0A8B2NZ12_9HYPH|nr:pyruvate, water dikinase regulatory protein [Acuticoccus sediminis]RAI03395.1 phosphoenolpyruvate synthase regulatory protein [Acuticoccus sediminis]
MASVNRKRTFVHVHLVSDSTGETLMTASRAAVARYEDVEAIEHVYPLVRSDRQLDRVLAEIEDAPGIVMFTLVDPDILTRLQATCNELGLPCIDVLDPLVAVFQSYLNVQKASRIGAQHELDAGYFRRIEALNFAMRHDDGALPDDIDEADVVLIGVSRTSKTPTSIYLAHRGVRATNLPIVTDLPLPSNLFEARRALIVGLTASPERIVALRENRLISMNAERKGSSYVNRQAVAKEVTYARKLCAENGWPLIDVTRRSIEETAAAIVALLSDRRYGSGGLAEDF